MPAFLDLPAAVTLTDVGPRDGFQAEATLIPTDAQVAAILGLYDAGLPEVQIASFVHPKRMPQMADAEAVCAAVPRREGVRRLGLALNARGVDRAVAAGVDLVEVSISTNDAHSRRNAGHAVADAEASMRDMIRTARAGGLAVRAGLSCVWGCGADGPEDADAVFRIASRILDQGVDQLSLADSTGQATPTSVARQLDALAPLAEAAGADLVLHLHDTRGAGLANVVEALRWGVTRFDTAFGGLGGCPFIPGATGNIPTEDTALLLEGMGVATGVDVAAVAAVSRQLEGLLGHGFSGRAYRLAAEPVA